MIKSVWFCILWLFAVTAWGQDEILGRLLETDGLKNAAIGISIKQVADGKVVVAHNAETALTPASVTKLMATWLALSGKGADYQYSTPVFYTGTIQNGILSGNIVLRAGGDPCLQSRYFPDHLLIYPLVAAIEKAGIREIRGQIIVEGAKKGTDIPGSWTWEDVSNYYAAQYLPFNYRDNTYTLTFRSGATGSPVKLLSVVPALPGVRILSEVEAAADNKDNAWIFGGPYSGVLCVKGNIPQNRSAYKVKGAMHNPVSVFVNEITGELKRKGILLGNKSNEEGKTTELLTLRSPRLDEIVFHTNKSSVNLYAEALGKLVGGEEWPEKAKQLLSEAGITTSGVILNDASGLSLMDAVPAQVFTGLLICAVQKTGESFVRSLPVAGVDGGLNGYCTAAPLLKNNLKAKTGSMSGVRCLAGYLTTRSGEQLAFTILINHYTCTTSHLQQAVGQFLQAVARSEIK